MQNNNYIPEHFEKRRDFIIKVLNDILESTISKNLVFK
jgi:hypothetical protein